MSHKFVNLETGEKVEIAYYRTPEQQKAYQEKKKKEAVLERSKNPFVFTEMDAFQGGLSVLDNKELGYFLIMQTYINYDNMLKIHPDAKHPMTVKELQQALKIKSPKTIRKLLKEFERLSLIYIDTVEFHGKKHEAIFIAEEYCFRKGIGGDYSKRKTDNAVKVFINSLQDVYAQDAIKPADIGFIYRTIEFIHYETNYLVLNPSERDNSKIIPLTVNALAEKMGLTREETSRKLSSLKWNGMYIYGRMKIGRKSL
jgi:hypothetical protein